MSAEQAISLAPALTLAGRMTPPADGLGAPSSGRAGASAHAAAVGCS
ncbi:MAG TPA: hypothetical protein VKY90_10285 [Candidatus Dormibacteraeota bacterium]|nr:hypothetical protein [Candidatus Dormibacteraeota bacterium]